MKPRDLNQRNWDVNYAVFETLGFEARVTADATRMWFRISTPLAFTDFMMPIREFRKAVDFLKEVRTQDIPPGPLGDGKRLGTNFVELIGWIGTAKPGKISWKKYPWTVHIAPARGRSNRSLSLRLSLFRKLARWYETDV